MPPGATSIRTSARWSPWCPIRRRRSDPDTRCFSWTAARGPIVGCRCNHLGAPVVLPTPPSLDVRSTMAARKTQTRSRADDAWSLPPLFESQTREGMKVIVMPRGTLPLVTVRVVIEAGSAYDPKGKEGLADFTIRLMRRGAAGMSAKELDDAIEFTGSSLSVGVSEELMILHLTCPEAHLKAMLGVVGKVLARPDFPEDELERLRSR